MKSILLSVLHNERKTICEILIKAIILCKALPDSFIVPLHRNGHIIQITYDLQRNRFSHCMIDGIICEIPEEVML